MKKPHFLLTLLLFTFALQGCKDAAPEGPAAPGTYSLCSYKSNLSADGYASARVSYPCEQSVEPSPAITLTGGYTNIKEQMYWLADHLTTHGFIVITVTPNNVFGNIGSWEDAHYDAYHKLLDENTRSDSPIAQLVDTDRIAMIGYSNGGTGAMRVANELGSAVHSVVALAPYSPPFIPEKLPNLSANSLLSVGTLDTTALPLVVEDTHENLPEGSLRTFVQYHWVSHFDWIALGRFHNKFKTLIVSWLDYSMNESTLYESYLWGEEHQQHINDGWYKDFEWVGLE